MILDDERVPLGSARGVVEQMVRATTIPRIDAKRLNRKLASALEEVSRLREHMEVVRRESLTDGLTNLPNRKAFDSALARAWASGETVVVAMVDVDHFKAFNDRWGHATGDQVLKFVGAMIGRTAHAPHLAARYGGEEFAMLFPGEAIDAVRVDLEAMLEHIRRRVLTRRTTGEQLGSLTVSVGLAEGCRENAADLLALADEALYASKHAGRDQASDWVGFRDILSSRHLTPSRKPCEQAILMPQVCFMERFSTPLVAPACRQSEIQSPF